MARSLVVYERGRITRPNSSPTRPIDDFASTDASVRLDHPPLVGRVIDAVPQLHLLGGPWAFQRQNSAVWAVMGVSRRTLTTMPGKFKALGINGISPLGAGDENRTRVLRLGTAPRPFFGTLEFSRKVLKTLYLLGNLTIGW